MLVEQTMVYVIDDGISGHDALPELLRSAGLRTSTFPSAAALLQADPTTEEPCVVADVRKHSRRDPGLERKWRSCRPGRRMVFITPEDLEKTLLVETANDDDLVAFIQWALPLNYPSIGGVLPSG
ncbi:MAG: response regulator [Pirellulaceae bacterium]